MADVASIKEQVRSTFRDHVIEGLPASGAYEPEKAAIRQVLEQTADLAQEALDIGSSAGTTIVQRTRAALIALPGPFAAGDRAEVRNDPAGNVANANGIYRYSGAVWEWLDPIVPAAIQAQVTAAAVTRADERVDAAILTLEAPPELVPLVVADNGEVAVWLEDGALNARNLHPSLIGHLADGTEAIPSGDDFIPLAVDEAGQVALWLQGGLLGAKGLTPALAEGISPDAYQPRQIPSAAALPLTTDGRSLFGWRAALAKFKQAGTGKPKVMLTGDSWTEYVAIPQQLAAQLHADHAKAGEGWISVNGLYLLNGVTFARSAHWTLYDASTGATPSNGSGLDGHAITAVDPAATVSIGNCKATEFRIYHSDSSGSWRWRIDGGAWTVVAGTNSGQSRKVTISGLADAVHTLDIDLSGNAGTVTLFGVYATRPTGVEIIKAGNAGLRGSQVPNFAANIGAIAADIVPDLIIVILGTNDYRYAGSEPAAFTAGLTALVSAYRTVLPNVGFVFIAPADSGGAPVTPLTEYRNAIYRFSLAGGHAFWNMHDAWPSYAVANGLGLWVDSLHLNNAGGWLLASEIKTNFLDL